MSATTQGQTAVVSTRGHGTSPGTYTTAGSGVVYFELAIPSAQQITFEALSIVGYSSTFVEAIETLSHDVSDIKQDVAKLKAAIENLTTLIATNALRTVEDSTRRSKSPPGRQSDKNTKKLIKDLFEKRHGETIYPSDIADELQIDYDQLCG